MLALSIFTTLLHIAVSDLGELPYYAKEQALKTKIFHIYEKSIPPLVNVTDSVTVSLDLSLQGVESLDIQTEKLTTIVWLNEKWSDVRLKFNRSEYNGHSSIRLPYADIWKPDLELFNSAAERNVPSADEHVVVESSGTVVYVSQRRLHSTCALDMTYFPFDEQLCIMKFGSWTYAGDVLVLTSTGIDTSTYTMNTGWELVEATHKVNKVTYTCCPEPYYDITFRIKLRRHTGLLMNMYVGPAVCFSLMVPAVFLLPTGSSHKLVLGSGLLICQVLLLAMLADFLPFTHFTAPKLVLYYMGNITLTSLSLIMSAVIMYLWERANRTDSGVPRGIKELFLGILGRVLCVRREDHIEHQATYSDSSKTEQTESGDTAAIVMTTKRIMASAEWRQLAVVLDRLLLCVYLVVTIVLVCSLLLYTA